MNAARVREMLQDVSDDQEVDVHINGQDCFITGFWYEDKVRILVKPRAE